MDDIKWYNKLARVLINFIAVFFTLIGMAILVTVLYISYYQNNIFVFGNEIDLTKANEFGGFINGFAGVFFTSAGVLLLYRTLQVQRVEFNKTQKAIELQQFESTFFNMLNVLHTLMISSEKSIGEGVIDKGYILFSRLSNELTEVLNELHNIEIQVILNKVEALEDVGQIEINDLKKFINSGYNQFYNENPSEISHYLRYFYSIVSYVHFNESIDCILKKKYIDLLQAQLSNQEMKIIFYNTINTKNENTEGYNELLTVIDSYHLLKNIDVEFLAKKSHHILYRNTEFTFLSKDAKGWKRSF